MTNYKYLIIGGGMTAAAAANGIREVDATGSIGLIGAETDRPYDRPPLTKALWKGKPVEEIWRKLDSTSLELHLGREVREIVRPRRSVIDDRGESFGYEKLLIATGGTPRRLPFDDGSIIYYRTLSDYRRLRALVGAGKRFAVIGGGFIGSEIAAALTLNGAKAVMIFPGKAVAAGVFPAAVAAHVSHYYQQKGVELVPGEKVTGIAARGPQRVLTTAAGREVVVDAVVAGLGIEPNTSLAQAIGLEVENGIVVDEQLRTSQPDIYAAGDVAAFFNPSLGKRLRVEHEDNGNTMGRLAGRNLAGESGRYHHLPFFYSDLFEIGYEAVGEVDSRLETFVDWKRPYEEGVIYYLKEGRVRGVLLWNVWEQVEAARRLIAEPGPFTAQTLKGRLPA
jgi:NADPH-dependent 2,4-dienoyl-CoA reductase/sulfur reductase-like enzyme